MNSVIDHHHQVTLVQPASHTSKNKQRVRVGADKAVQCGSPGPVSTEGVGSDLMTPSMWGEPPSVV